MRLSLSEQRLLCSNLHFKAIRSSAVISRLNMPTCCVYALQGDNRLANQVLQQCQLYGLPQVAVGVCRQMGVHQWQAGRHAAALSWFIRGASACARLALWEAWPQKGPTSMTTCHHVRPGCRPGRSKYNVANQIYGDNECTAAFCMACP